jgi:Protein of unknown function (DUF3300)
MPEAIRAAMIKSGLEERFRTMNRDTKRWAVVLAASAWLVMGMGYVSAQESPPSSEEAPAEQATTPPAAAPLTSAQLDQLTAPIALYSDPLLGMVLTAATYPLEIVEAARWLDADRHASLTGDELNAALAQESWDTSVKALVAVPEVLRMMNENLEWTEELGDVFLSQQSDVMDSVQRLRRRATASGALQSSPQENVSTDEGDVIIEPPTPDEIYVPCYTPVIYGPWPWPDYPAFYFPPPAGFCYPGALISFGIGFGIIGPYWGWGRWSWPHHGFYVGPRGPHRGPIPIRPWVHDPAHRHGVPYRDMATAKRYLGPNASSWRGYRGYPTPSAHAPRPGFTPRAAPGYRIPLTRPGPPAFQSYGPGPRVRSEAARGSFSRSAPGPHGGGGHPGGGHPGGRPPH